MRFVKALGLNPLFSLLFAIVLVAACSNGPTGYNTIGPPPPPPTSGTPVSIKNFAFDPTTLIVKTGTKVVWVNGDADAHTVTSDSGNLLNSGEIPYRGYFALTFTDTGSVSY